MEVTKRDESTRVVRARGVDVIVRDVVAEVESGVVESSAGGKGGLEGIAVKGGTASEGK